MGCCEFVAACARAQHARHPCGLDHSFDWLLAWQYWSGGTGFCFSRLLHLGLLLLAGMDAAGQIPGVDGQWRHVAGLAIFDHAIWVKRWRTDMKIRTLIL